MELVVPVTIDGEIRRWTLQFSISIEVLVDAFGLKTGMVISATKIVETPDSVVAKHVYRYIVCCSKQAQVVYVQAFASA
jgi:hypothetical protein